MVDVATKKSSPNAKPKDGLKLLGKKCGMIQMFDANGRVVPCTVIHAEPNVVTQIKTLENDGYEAIQFAFDEVRVKDARTIANRVTKPLRGHFSKAQVLPCRHLRETQVDDISQYQVGQKLGVTVFQNVKYVDVVGVSKGKGYQGVMKLHGFRGGPASHGSGFHRHAGSTGMRSTPGRCLPGGPRPSHMGDDRVTVQNLRVVAIDEAKNLIMVEGATPGAKGALLEICESIKLRKV
jgi:large subunit ribosomal protein L3